VKGKIGLEEHFAIEDTLNDSKGFLPDDVWPELRGRLIDIHDRRIAEMDRHGVEMMVLSLNAPSRRCPTRRAQARWRDGRMIFWPSR